LKNKIKKINFIAGRLNECPFDLPIVLNAIFAENFLNNEKWIPDSYFIVYLQ